MSKQIKQMQMDDLRKTFGDVRDMVFLTLSGVDCHADNQMRTTLRKKKIRLQQVKNTLARRIFDELKVQVKSGWVGPTTVAWGSGSLAELSKEIEALAKKNKNIKVKLAVSEGAEITFAQALKMPTKAEAAGRVLALVLSPAGRVASQIKAPAGRVAGQIKSVSEKAPAEDVPAPADTPVEVAAAPAAG
jgi:ribosomal protein L10